MRTVITIAAVQTVLSNKHTRKEEVASLYFLKIYSSIQFKIFIKNFFFLSFFVFNQIFANPGRMM